jgi:hypothetical protein
MSDFRLSLKLQIEKQQRITVNTNTFSKLMKETIEVCSDTRLNNLSMRLMAGSSTTYKTKRLQSFSF